MVDDFEEDESPLQSEIEAKLESALAQDDLRAARTKGVATAPVTIYEMSDFQCPYCRRFSLETFPALEREYVATGKVRWEHELARGMTRHVLARVAGGAAKGPEPD